MFRFILVLALSSGFVFSSIDWVYKGQISDPTGYLSRVIQELVYDLEKLEWCNLKVDEYSQTLEYLKNDDKDSRTLTCDLFFSDQMYQWHVNGTVTYSNGFVVSIQALDITNFGQFVYNRLVDGVVVPHATVNGRLNMHHVKIGFDVDVELFNAEPPHAPHQRYTSHYTHTLIQLQIDVTKNLLTNIVTSSPDWTSISGGTGIRMIYLPANNLTEVLSRRYVPSLNEDSVEKWCTNIFGPMIVDIASNREHFPELCFNDCPL